MDALQVYEELGRLEPTRGIHFFQVGNMNLLLKRYAAAETAYQKVVDLEPERADGYQALAQCYVVAKRNVDRAPALARRAVQLSPTAPVYAVLSLACERTGDRAAARQAMQQALQLDPGNADYRRRLLALEQQR